MRRGRRPDYYACLAVSVVATGQHPTHALACRGYRPICLANPSRFASLSNPDRSPRGPESHPHRLPDSQAWPWLLIHGLPCCFALVHACGVSAWLRTLVGVHPGTRQHTRIFMGPWCCPASRTTNGYTTLTPSYPYHAIEAPALGGAKGHTRLASV